MNEPRLTEDQVRSLNEAGAETERLYGAGPRYFDRAGEAMGLGDWTARFGTDYQRVLSTLLHRLGEVLTSEHLAHARPESWKPEDTIHVSTVWLGLDHGFGREGPPVIFETMIFGGSLHEEQMRYSTESEARAGHVTMVERARVLLDERDSVG